MGFRHPLVWLLLLLGSAFAQQDSLSPDFHQCRTGEFTVRVKGKSLRISGHWRVDHTFVTERSTLKPDFSIAGFYRGKVDDVTVWHRGRKLSGDRIHAYYPNFEDWFFNETRYWFVNLPGDIRPDDKVSWEYDVAYDDVTHFPVLRIPNLNRLGEMTLRFRHPANVRLDFDFFFPADTLKYRVERTADKETAIFIEAGSPLRDLPYYEFNNLRAAMVTHFYLDSQLVSPSAVEALNRWYGGEVGFSPRLELDSDSALMRDVAASVTDAEKLKTIYDFVRKNIRYVHDARFAHQVFPSQPADVLARRYGDCKDRAYLLQALARSAGLNVKFVLQAAEPDVLSRCPHISLMNHAICVFENGDSLLFMDPTAKYAPMGSLPEGDISRDVLILDSLAPRVTTLDPPDTTASILLDVEAVLDSLSWGRATLTLRQGNFMRAARVLEEMTGRALEEAMDEIVTRRLYKIALDSFVVVSQGYDSLVFQARADLSEFLVASPGRKYLPRLPFTTIDNDLLKREKDLLPLYFPNREAIRVRISLAAPDLEVEPDSVEISDGGPARFKAVSSNTGPGRVSLFYSFDRSQRIIRDQAKVAFLAFCHSCLNEKQKMFALKGGGK